MKNQVLKLSILLLSLSLFASCKKENRLKGSGVIVSESRSIASFDEVFSSTSIPVNVTYGSTQKVEIVGDDNILSSVQTTVSNSSLFIDLKQGNYKNIDVTVNLTIPNLSRIENSGSGDFSARNFSNLPSITVKNSGSGDVSINGSADELTIDNSGSGDLKAYSFITKKCYLTNSGSGSSKIHSTTLLSGANSGSGDVYYKGSPSLSIRNSGSGSIINAN